MEKEIRSMLAAGICCLVLLLAGCKDQAGLYVTRTEEAVREAEHMADEAGAEADGDVPKGDARGAVSDTKEEAGEDGTSGEIYVQVSGAVINPGVYKLPEGSRIFEAVEMAGGTSEEADLASVNQAERLADGQMIYVYAVGEEREGMAGVPQAGETSEDGRVNINTASAEELMTLPGIGQSKAEDIISWREKNGGFGRIEDIMNIQGIKEGVFSKLEDHIKVN